MGVATQNFVATLKQSGIYHRLKASLICDLYLNLKDRRLAKARAQEAVFYRTLLHGFRRGDLIFDIGANIGDKVDTFLRIGARVVAVDPDENIQTILRQKYLRYRRTPRPVTIVGKAVGAAVGVQTMLVCAPGSVLNTLSKKGASILRESRNRPKEWPDRLEYNEQRKVETTTLDNLIDTYGVPALIKIDVVGFELEVLQGLHCTVPCLSFEISLPEFKQELLQCIEILGGLSPCGKFNYTWDHRNGLALDEWLEVQAFIRVLEGCCEGSLEVFWRTPR